MDNLKFRKLLYGLTKDEWIALLGESLGMWFNTVNEEDLPEVGAISKNFYNDKPIRKLYKRDLLTDVGCYTEKGVEFIKQLYAYQTNVLPFPVVKDLKPNRQLSSDREATFNHITHVLKQVVSNDEMRPALNCVSVTEDGIVATNGHILFFVGYVTGQEPFFYNPVLGEKLESETEYPKWREIVWDIKEVDKHYNTLVLEMFSKLKLMVKLFPDEFGRNIVVNGQRFSIHYLNKIFKVFYKLGVVDCDMYIKGEQKRGMIIKGKSKGFEFLAIIMALRAKGEDHELVWQYQFNELIAEQESTGFLGMM